MIKLEQYRDIWISEHIDEVIGFYPREFYALDNFSSFKVEWNGYLYASLEEAYQAASFMGSSEELVERVKHSHSADEAQRIAYANRDKQRPDWNEVKVAIMEELLRLKIEQNPYVKKKLLQTENYLIVEDSPKDSFWGWGPNRDGENQLGKLWMKLREELKNELNIAKEKMNNISEKLLQNDNELINRIDSIRKSCINLKDIEDKVKNTNNIIHENINKINDGIEIINELPDNIHKISTGIDQFEEGINAISDGTNQLYEGISRFNKEGINKISSLVNNDVRTKVNKLHQIVELGNNYSSFAGDNSNKEGTTKFIMIIDSLSIPKEIDIDKKEEKLTLWDRIKSLFK